MKLEFPIVTIWILASLVVSGCGAATVPPPTASVPALPATVTDQVAVAVSPSAAFSPTAAATAAVTTQALEPTATSTPLPAVQPSPTSAPAPTSTPTAAPFPTAPRVEVFVSGLDTPWAIAFAPDGRIFLTERPGRIRVVRDGKLDPEPWMTLGVSESGEAGLLGLALSPEFAKDHLLYVAYSYRAPDGGLRSRLVRLREDGATGKGVLDKVLLEGVRGNLNHDGGRVKFGPDGMLYWTVGDAQDAAAAQNPALPNGKILRLKPDGTIPSDNPFPGSPVYSYGHRNPEGLAWQPETGRLYATEHGPSGAEGCCQDEINLIEPGKNYGWPEITGDATKAGMVSPVINSGKTDTWAPSGATFVTSGPWRGSLLFAGLRGQALYRLTLDPADPRKVLSLEPLLKDVYGRLRDVAQGPDGAIYVLTSNADGRGTPPPDGDRVLRLTFTN